MRVYPNNMPQKAAITVDVVEYEHYTHITVRRNGGMVTETQVSHLEPVENASVAHVKWCSTHEKTKKEAINW